MEIDRNKLPEDPAALRQMVAGLLEELDTKERRLQQLQHMVEQLLRWRYGPKRERVNENQLFLYAVGIIGTGQEQPHPDVEDMAGDAYRNPSSGGAWSTISENRNGNVPSARESCSTSARRSVSGWNTCRLRCM
jgi:hypothetical protein